MHLSLEKGYRKTDHPAWRRCIRFLTVPIITRHSAEVNIKTHICEISQLGGESLKDPFSENLIRLREQVGLTQTFVADKLNVRQSAVSHWETGKVRPSRKYHPMLADLYGVTVDEIMGKEKKKEEKED